MNPDLLNINDYYYDLPAHRIAMFPKEPRDKSKLLYYKNGQVTDHIFDQLPDILPFGGLMVFNNSRVIHARLLFETSTGAGVEIFCLEPSRPGNPRYWHCMIGNLKKWKEPKLSKKVSMPQAEILLEAELLEKKAEAYEVMFTITPADVYDIPEVIEQCGLLPLPPYIKRMATQSDEESYQTVYAEHPGSVAAPTAGLHFTPSVLDALSLKNITQTYLTLHVGAGTFAPVKEDKVKNHVMHSERIILGIESLKALHEKSDRMVIAVGTTSLRTLETIYRLGNKILQPGFSLSDVWASQWEAFENPSVLTRKQSLENVLEYMDKKGLQSLEGTTRLMVAPGYQVKMVDAIITNFHQPKSTLMLLIAAMVGEDWKKIYKHALANEYRFLSYGDSSLLFKQG
jgi:S-adenosylmethionine:tRNA ribosyltransferase-isomerase